TISVSGGIVSGLLDAPAISGAGWTCNLATIICTRPGPLAAGAHAPALTVSGTAHGGVFIIASVSVAGDNISSNNTTFASVSTPAPDLGVTLVPSGAFRIGQTGSYVATVSNAGVATTTGAITLTLDGFQQGSASGSGWSCGTPTQFGSTVCTHPGPLAANASLPAVTYSGTVAGPTGFGDASVSTPPHPPKPNHFVTRSHTRRPHVDSPATAARSGPSGGAGPPISFPVPVAKGGSATAPPPVVVSFFSGGIDIASATGSGWDCSVDEQTCTRSSAV